MLAIALKNRFDQLGQCKDLEEAITLHLEVLKLFPPGHDLRASSLDNFAIALTSQFKQSG